MSGRGCWLARETRPAIKSPVYELRPVNGASGIDPAQFRSRASLS